MGRRRQRAVGDSSERAEGEGGRGRTRGPEAEGARPRTTHKTFYGPSIGGVTRGSQGHPVACVCPSTEGIAQGFRRDLMSRATRYTGAPSVLRGAEGPDVQRVPRSLRVVSTRGSAYAEGKERSRPTGGRLRACISLERRGSLVGATPRGPTAPLERLRGLGRRPPPAFTAAGGGPRRRPGGHVSDAGPRAFGKRPESESRPRTSGATTHPARPASLSGHRGRDRRRARPLQQGPWPAGASPLARSRRAPSPATRRPWRSVVRGRPGVKGPHVGRRRSAPLPPRDRPRAHRLRRRHPAPLTGKGPAAVRPGLGRRLPPLDARLYRRLRRVGVPPGADG